MFDPKNIPIHEKSRVNVEPDLSPIFDTGLTNRLERHWKKPEDLESNLHTPGAKDDLEKVDLSIILECFPRALWEVGRVSDYGAKKYSRGGCLQVKNAMQRYEAADMRHKLSRHKGEECDPESGMLHLAHCAWNALIKLELFLREKEK